MKIEEFLKNPAGKNSTFLNIKATQESFDKRYQNYFPNMHAESYILSNNDIYIHVYFPSSVQGTFYDIVVGFHPSKESGENDMTQMDIKMFSNCPSFLYTYGYAYMKSGLFLKSLENKLSTKIKTDMAKTKNSFNVISYDISIYSALRFIVDKNYLDRRIVAGIKVGNSLGALNAKVLSANQMTKERKVNSDLVKKEKATEAAVNAAKEATTTDKTGKSKQGITTSKTAAVSKVAKTVSTVKKIK